MSEPLTREPTTDDLVAAAPLKRKPRLQPISTKAEIEAVPWFDDEDREVCASTLVRSIRLYGAQPTIVVRSACNDPKGAMAKFAYGAELNELLGNSGSNRHTIRGTPMNLLVVMTLQSTGEECLHPSIMAGNGNDAPGFKAHHYHLMDFPESEVWNPEQALMLRYARALLDNTMTDALWDEAVKQWGVKMCLRYIQLLGHFWTTGIRNRTLKMPYALHKED